MKFRKRFILGSVIFVLLCFFIPSISFSIDAFITRLFHAKFESGTIYKTKEQCQSNKGVWGKAGLFPTEFCRIPTGDAGKWCIAGFQCNAGVCLAKYQFRKGPLFTTGQCPGYSIYFGCTQEVHFGFASQGICRD